MACLRFPGSETNRRPLYYSSQHKKTLSVGLSTYTNCGYFSEVGRIRFGYQSHRSNLSCSRSRLDRGSENNHLDGKVGPGMGSDSNILPFGPYHRIIECVFRQHNCRFRCLYSPPPVQSPNSQQDLTRPAVGTRFPCSQANKVKAWVQVPRLFPMRKSSEANAEPRKRVSG